MGLIAALIIRISAERYPPFMERMFTTAYELTDNPSCLRMRTKRHFTSMH